MPSSLNVETPFGYMVLKGMNVIYIDHLGLEVLLITEFLGD